ncbi:hypothetical protein GBF38_014420 [Nibea albiflora]|uniref:Uncharacterized protein n=1 Tax=Nibea albiflora TaxID=240163 RepID=A0ACB7F741_NIBAL|nr:hypothetical protein GBF38_014420 [Nibea albiflora]
MHFTRECFSNYGEVAMGFKKQLLLNPDAVPIPAKAVTQVRVASRDCGVCTLTFPLDSPLLFLQPTLVKRPPKRPRLSLTDEEEGPSECNLSTAVQEPEDST